MHKTNEGGECLKEVQGELCRMTNTTYHITFAFHTQANGLVECIECTFQAPILKCIDN